MLTTQHGNFALVGKQEIQMDILIGTSLSASPLHI